MIKAKGLDDEQASIYGMVENVEQLLSRLAQLVLNLNTVVVFVTENGPNGYRYNSDMKVIKGAVDEGGARAAIPATARKDTSPNLDTNLCGPHRFTADTGGFVWFALKACQPDRWPQTGVYQLSLQYTARVVALRALLTTRSGNKTLKQTLQTSFDPPLKPSPDRITRKEIHEKT
ncbi:hypothetical protein GCM10027341_50700 [Spirosoma knui]